MVQLAKGGGDPASFVQSQAPAGGVHQLDAKAVKTAYLQLSLHGQGVKNDNLHAANHDSTHPPTHLIVLMHGVLGRSSHMSSLLASIEQRLGASALVVSTSSYARMSSLRGARFAGNAVFAEIQAHVAEVILGILLESDYCMRESEKDYYSRLTSFMWVSQHKPTLKYISLCGYSFGGVVGMWVAARLHEHSFLKLRPLNFITVACPHLGATDPQVCVCVCACACV